VLSVAKLSLQGERSTGEQMEPLLWVPHPQQNISVGLASPFWIFIGDA
jgi:hypothetical protein